MATLLHRVGRFSYRRRWRVIGVWALLLALVGGGAATLAGTMSNSFSIPGTESQRAIDELAARFPQAHVGGASAQVVFVAPAGQTLTEPANRAAITDAVAALRAAPKVTGVADPFQTRSLSPDMRYAIAQVSYAVQNSELVDEDRAALIAALDPARRAGLTAEIGGDALLGAPATGVVEVIGVLAAAVVLVITLGSLLAAGMPLLTAAVGVGVGLGGIVLASRFTDINANSLILALMLGLAVGIDYALFIVSRYRHELLVGHPGREAAGREAAGREAAGREAAGREAAGREAAGRAVGTAGSAVVFAGLTVIIALVGLTVVGIPLLGSMGVAAAGVVAVAVLVAVTLLPALLGVFGRKVAAARLPRRAVPDPESDSGPVPAGERWARFVTRFRVPVLLLSLAALAAVAVPVGSLRLGLPDDGMAPAGTTRRQAYDLIAEGFGPGFNGPLTVVVSGGADTGGDAGTVAAGLRGLPGVAAVTPAQLSPDGSTALLTVVPVSAPNDEATGELVDTIRDRRADLTGASDAEIAVTGATALNVDIATTIGDALVPYLILVVGLAFLLLMLVFRSVLVPVKATLGFLLSVGATFGAVVAVFQWGWLSEVFGVAETGPIMSLLPVLLVGILFGLAMDYQVFLVTRMREDHAHGADAQHAVVTGFRHGARVVTAAAIIMISVFSGFIFSEEVLIKSIGFALALGVAVDAFLVRMTVVPAVMSLLGRAAWWLPRWLDRLLPAVDVEGERLTGAPPAPPPSPAILHFGHRK